jgi:hypothetical protein
LKADKIRKRSIANVQMYKDVFSSGAGQKVLWDLMKNNSMVTDSHVVGDPYSTAYNEGRRAVVLHILEKININVQALEKKYQEGLKNEAEITELS